MDKLEETLLVGRRYRARYWLHLVGAVDSFRRRNPFSEQITFDLEDVTAGITVLGAAPGNA